MTDSPRETRERRLQALHGATRELMAGETREEVAEAAVRAASDVLGFDVSSIHLYREGAGLVPVAATDATNDLIDDVPTLAEGESIAWRVFRTGEPAVFEDVRSDRDAYNPETAVRSELHLPLGEFGILIAASPTRSEFDEAELSLGEVFAANIETALEQVDRKRELLRQNERLEEFASVVSHDLRGPLSVAQGYLALAREDGKPEQFEQLERAHDRMERIVDDVLFLAREGDRIGATEPVDLSATVGAAWGLVPDADGPAELTVADGLGTVTADEARLRQLFENLFRNAVEHAGPDVRVTVEPTETGFAVADDGPGVPADNRDSVFDRGYTTGDGGIGLGLHIVAQIADAHGWEVRVTESEAGGARFEVAGARR